MTRTPLRPLARILSARAKGENPDAIERENIRLRHEAMRDTARLRAEGRLLLLGVTFVAAFLTIGARMGLLAATEPVEPQTAYTGVSIVAQRADITDRQGRILATNLITHSLYAQPQQMVDPEGSARKLAEIFPDLDVERLKKDFAGARKFLWVKKKISPEQMQLVHEIGDPGLLFGPREMRLYPNGALAAHVLGGASFGREGVQSAEVVGIAGVEKTFDTWLRDPANGGAPLKLSLDLTVQASVEEVLYGGMKLLNARGAAATLMDANTGEIIAMASLPDFDPNTRPRVPAGTPPGESPVFDRAVQGIYEYGSVFKLFTISQAIDLGLVTPDTVLDTKGPLYVGKFRIKDFRRYGDQLSVTQILEKSSNIGTARIALQIGAERQQAFFRQLGFGDPTPIEVVEAQTSRPILQKRWSDIVTVTTAYGQGIAITQAHLAAAYASIVNGGTRVTPTLLPRTGVQAGERIVSEETSAKMRNMLRLTVAEGTATLADVPGYNVGGKTGTANKPDPKGGYYDDKNIATFAAAFPMSDPKYVLVVSLDEPVEASGTEPRRTAGWTAVPVGAEIIRRAAPLLGLRPELEPVAEASVIRVRN
ncbi:MAG: cell division protein FtsI [Rhodobacterales bacterium 32-67-9]|nr:MAG: cell division protein FtsI [Rhodobacterales bacterium 32-67-9]